jgi:hypothetical protein
MSRSVSQSGHSGQEPVEQDDVAIDVVANDLVHIGVDSKDLNHYYDEQRDRIIVTSERHEMYSRDGSVLVRRQLVADADAVETVVDDVEGALNDYVLYVAAHVNDRDWVRVTVDLLDAAGLMDGIGGT